MHRSIRLPFVLALASTMMLGPFSTDTYLPAFPAIGHSLGVTTQQVGLTVSVYIFALAFGQLVGGPLSDRFGRKPILYAGLGMFAVSSLGIAAVDGLSAMLVGRAAQAIGAGWALLSVPALVRDRVQGLEAAKLFSMMGLIMVLAPGIAPSIGSALLQLGPWNMIFVALAGYGLSVIPLLRWGVFSGTHATPAPPPPSTRLIDRYLSVLGQRPALPFVAWQVGAFSTMMLFITHASFLYQEHFGLSEGVFSLVFAANIVAMFVANIVNRTLLSRVRPLRLLQSATILQGVGVLLVVAAAAFDWPLVLFVPSMVLAIGSMGAIGPNIQACYMEHFPREAGTAAALLGAAQFGLAGVVTGLSALLPHTVLVVALAMASCSAVAVGLAIRSVMQIVSATHARDVRVAS